MEGETPRRRLVGMHEVPHGQVPDEPEADEALDDLAVPADDGEAVRGGWMPTPAPPVPIPYPNRV